MNIESLRYFQMIAKEGNISGVAKKVHLSQSALSQQLQKLENQMSRPLMERSNKGITLTSTGVIVSRFADTILRTYDEMLDEITQSEAQNLYVKIKSCVWIAGYALPCTLIKANKTYPGHNYELSGSASEEIPADVANGLCDVGFCCSEEGELHYKDLLCSKAGESAIVLAAKNIPAFPDQIAAEALTSTPLILCSDKHNLTKILLSRLRRIGYKINNLNCSMRVEEIESAKKLVSNGYGMAFLPYMSIREELYKKQLKLISVPDLDLTVNILMLRRPDAPGHVQDFVRWFHKHGANSFC